MNNSITFLLFTLLSVLSVSVCNAWTMPRRSATSGFRLVPKRFRNSNNNNNNNNNKSQQPSANTETERYFRNGFEDGESISMNIIAMTPSSSSQLQSSVMANDYDMKMPSVVSTEPSPTTIAASTIRDIDLPRRSPPANAVANAVANANANKILWDVEIVLGRFAMVTALLMLVGELGFGVSPLLTLMGIF